MEECVLLVEQNVRREETKCLLVYNSDTSFFKVRFVEV